MSHSSKVRRVINSYILEENIIEQKQKSGGITMKFKNQKQMFDWIWENRRHVSELSGNILLSKTHPKWHFQMAHILPKGNYPKWKLNPDNIMLMLPEEHENQEQFLKFVEKKSELRRQYYKQYYNKEF
jgi:hypothetical protein